MSETNGFVSEVSITKEGDILCRQERCTKRGNTEDEKEKEMAPEESNSRRMHYRVTNRKDRWVETTN